MTQIIRNRHRSHNKTVHGKTVHDKTVHGQTVFGQTVHGRRARCADILGRCGLTLIEILIATTLMAALLVALWRLVGIYTSLRDKGELHAGRVGNVSVMMQQLEEDLQNMPDVRTQAAPFVETTVQHDVETGPVDSEVMAFDEAYDDEPSVETLSESAIESEGSGRRFQAISQDHGIAESEEDSFDSQQGLNTDNFESEQSVNQQAQSCLTQSEDDCNDSQSIAGDPAAASCLVGDERSLTLSNLDSQLGRRMGEGGRRMGEGAGGHSHDRPIESDLSHDTKDYELSEPAGSGSSTDQFASSQHTSNQHASGDGVAVQMPVRFVRYWLAGAMPLMAQAAEAEQDREDGDGADLSITGNGSVAEMETTGSLGAGATGKGEDQNQEERAGGLYREEVVGVSAPVQMGSLHGQSSLENLRFGSFSDPSKLSGMSGLDNFNEMEDSEEVIRRSFHLAQVEWAKFRYFDGNRWSSAWDSRVQGELPVAIEMSLWLLRLNAKSKSNADLEISQNSLTAAEGATWTETEAMNEPDSQFPIAAQESHAGNGQLSSLADDNPMERQPEVRQLVVLRSAPSSGDTLPVDGSLGDELLDDGLLDDGLRGSGLREDGLLRNSTLETNSNFSSPSSTLMMPVQP
jgi:hypothetical protein